MTIQLVEACSFSITNFATSLARSPTLAITIPSLPPSWTSRFPRSTCSAPGTPRLPAFHTGETGRKDKSSFNTCHKNTNQQKKSLQVFERNLLEEYLVSIYDKDILLSALVENPLAVANKKERERAIKNFLLAKKISHQDAPNHGISNFLQLLRSPQNSQTFRGTVKTW